MLTVLDWIAVAFLIGCATLFGSLATRRGKSIPFVCIALVFASIMLYSASRIGASLC